MRSAQFLGARGVMASQKNCAPLSAVVSKASAGALEALPVHACANLPRLLSEAAASGWSVLGAAAEEGAVDCTAAAVQGPTILVVGSEGELLNSSNGTVCSPPSPPPPSPHPPGGVSPPCCSYAEVFPMSPRPSLCCTLSCCGFISAFCLHRIAVAAVRAKAGGWSVLGAGKEGALKCTAVAVQGPTDGWQ